MAYKGMREFLEVLEAEGELMHITEPVDWNVQIGATSRRLCDLETNGTPVPAVMFENIKDYPGGRFFTNSLASWRRYALALGLPKDTSRMDIVEAFYQRVKTPIPPVVLDKADALCKENILLGDDIDVTKFPAPQWHAQDGNRFLGTFHAFINKDLDSDWVNWGMYRVAIHDKKTIGINIPPGMMNHAHIIHKGYIEKNMRMPVAVVMGDCPTLPIVSAANFPAGVNEVEYAGALRQAPFELVKAETNDLLVPAHAEIVIEGYIDPGELRDEGPFGEYTGYYAGGRHPKPVIHVTCITHRNDPILIGSQEGVPLVDDHYMAGISMSALARQVLLDTVKVPGVKKVFYHPEANWAFCVVSVEKAFDGHANTIAQAIWSSRCGSSVGFADFIVVVDHDIDPSNLTQVLWALAGRCNPIEDMQFVRNKGFANFLDPKIPLADRKKLISSSGVVIDAAWKYEWRVSAPENIPPVSNWEDWAEPVRRFAADLVDRNLT